MVCLNNQIPDNVLDDIFNKFLNASDLARMRCVCTGFRDVADSVA